MKSNDKWSKTSAENKVQQTGAMVKMKSLSRQIVFRRGKGTWARKPRTIYVSEGPLKAHKPAFCKSENIEVYNAEMNWSWLKKYDKEKNKIKWKKKLSKSALFN
jgi:hypothetical protein